MLEDHLVCTTQNWQSEQFLTLQVMIWGWVGISLFSLAVAYSLAEMCSEYPVAGGQYSWVYVRYSSIDYSL